MDYVFRLFSRISFVISFSLLSLPAIGAMVMIDDNRYISSGSTTVSPGSSTTGSYWSVNAGFADQYSSISETYLYGNGSVSRPDSFITNSSVYDVTFYVDEALSFDFTGEFLGSSANIDAWLYENGELLFHATNLRFGTGILNFTHSGMFEIGNEYTLNLTSSIGCCGIGPDQSWDFDLFTEIAPVPVPAAVWLMISGLVALIGFARIK